MWLGAALEVSSNHRVDGCASSAPPAHISSSCLPLTAAAAFALQRPSTRDFSCFAMFSIQTQGGSVGCLSAVASPCATAQQLVMLLLLLGCVVYTASLLQQFCSPVLTAEGSLNGWLLVRLLWQAAAFWAVPAAAVSAGAVELLSRRCLLCMLAALLYEFAGCVVLRLEHVQLR